MNIARFPIRMERTEEGKRLRYAYEHGEIKHGYNEYRTCNIRKNGVMGAITTVQKDLFILVAKKGEKR